MKGRAHPREAWQWLPVLSLLVIVGADAAHLLSLTHGHFFYSLDDSYISLRMAENIVRGWYGINPGIPGSASSSALWPFLLAPFAKVGLLTAAPLIINLFFGILTARMLGNILAWIFGEEKPLRPYLALASVLLVPALNLPALVLSGMEHMLQVWLTLAIAFELLKLHTGRTQPHAWLLAALVLGPLMRLENLGVSGAAILYLMASGHTRQGVLAGGFIVLSLGAFALFLTAMGLPPVPSSVLTKLFLSGSLLEQWADKCNYAQCWVMAAGVGAFWLAGYESIDTKRRRLAFLMALPLLAHLLFGRVWPSSRFELYALAFSLPLLLWLHKKRLLRLLGAAPRWRALGGIALVLLCTSGTYFFHSLWTTALSARDLYLQQAQMARFAQQEYQGAVGVNDIGLVSYHNPYPVLDFIGISENEPREAFWKHYTGALMPSTRVPDPAWMDTLAKKRKVGLVMIYTPWFGASIPHGWEKMATLSMEPRPFSVPYRSVEFYVTNLKERRRVRTLLEEFSKDLPEGARLTLGR
jgi:hypothetical protein